MDLEGVAAQQSAEPMVDAAVQHLQSGTHLEIFQMLFGPPLPAQVQLDFVVDGTLNPLFATTPSALKGIQ